MAQLLLAPLAASTYPMRRVAKSAPRPCAKKVRQGRAQKERTPLGARPPGALVRDGSVAIGDAAAAVLVARVAVVLVLDAFEAAGARRIADTLVLRHLREGAKRALELDAVGRIVVDVVRRDDLLRRDTVLHPLLQRLEKIVVGIDRWPVHAVAESVRAVAAAAMRHSRHHEQPIELLCLLKRAAVAVAPRLAAQNLAHFVVVVDAVHRGDCRIG